MLSVHNMIALISNRAAFYTFLARLYQVEVDQPLLDQMHELDLNITADEEDIDEGYKLLGNYLRQRNTDVLTDLAVDYSRVFLGAGIVDGKAAFPYESVYTSPEHLIMQDARDQVLEFYYREGLDKSDSLDYPEDHIGLELEFMAYLCKKTCDSLISSDPSSAKRLLETQKAFLREHLMNWVPDFCADIEKHSQTNFYLALAKITRGLLKMESSIVNQIIEELGVAPV